MLIFVTFAYVKIASDRTLFLYTTQRYRQRDKQTIRQTDRQTDRRVKGVMVGVRGGGCLKEEERVSVSPGLLSTAALPSIPAVNLWM